MLARTALTVMCQRSWPGRERSRVSCPIERSDMGAHGTSTLGLIGPRFPGREHPSRRSGPETTTCTRTSTAPTRPTLPRSSAASATRTSDRLSDGRGAVGPRIGPPGEPRQTRRSSGLGRNGQLADSNDGTLPQRQPHPESLPWLPRTQLGDLRRAGARATGGNQAGGMPSAIDDALVVRPEADPGRPCTPAAAGLGGQPDRGTCRAIPGSAATILGRMNAEPAGRVRPS